MNSKRMTKAHAGENLEVSLVESQCSYTSPNDKERNILSALWQDIEREARFPNK